MFDYDKAFSRNIGWVTEPEQQILRNKRVAIADFDRAGLPAVAPVSAQRTSVSISPSVSVRSFSKTPAWAGEASHGGISRVLTR